LLEGKTVNLRIVEKEDVSLVAEWVNNPDLFGEFMQLMQVSMAERARKLDGFNHKLVGLIMVSLCAELWYDFVSKQPKRLQTRHIRE
jgi:hypothetical protein